MAPQPRMASRGIIEYPDVRQNYGIRLRRGRLVHRTAPRPGAARWRKGVDRDQHLASPLVCKTNAFHEFVEVEVEARVVAGVRAIAEPAIDGIGTGVDRGAQRRGRARRAYELEIPRGHDVFSSRRCWRASSRPSRAVSATISFWQRSSS